MLRGQLPRVRTNLVAALLCDLSFVPRATCLQLYGRRSRARLALPFHSIRVDAYSGGNREDVRLHCTVSKRSLGLQNQRVQERLEEALQLRQQEAGQGFLRH